MQRNFANVGFRASTQPTISLIKSHHQTTNNKQQTTNNKCYTKVISERAIAYLNIKKRDRFHIYMS